MNRRLPAEEAAELRAATREAHEAMQDMRILLEECRAITVEMATIVKVEIDGWISDQVKAGLADYNDTMLGAIDDATEAVYNRFDVLVRILCEGTKAQQRKEGESIPAKLALLFGADKSLADAAVQGPLPRPPRKGDRA